MIKWLTILPFALFGHNLVEIMNPDFEQIKPGSEFIFAKKIPAALENSIQALSTEKRWRDFLAEYEPKKIEMEKVELVLKKLHLNLTSVNQETIQELFDSKSDFVFFLKKWLPHLNALPKEMQGDFLSEVAEKYLDIFPPDHEGRIHFFVEGTRIEIAEK
ncbi:MAG: hypothetical protein WDZ28_05545 [Simkaniaceae bacterium]